jgi:hypothetical protein
MRFDPKLERHRFITARVPVNGPGHPSGMFIIPGPAATPLEIIVDDGTVSGWEHVSVCAFEAESFKRLLRRGEQPQPRTPTWAEMCHVKNLFWSAEDCVVQFHPPQSDYVNRHPHVLHLWRWRGGEFPRPPSRLVGSRASKEETEREVKQP